MQEGDMVRLTTARVRLAEAAYFRTQFIANCGPPQDSWFHMVCYFDAFLFALTSVEEMVDAPTKSKLKDTDVFRFVKALRNITMHHSVLAASSQGSKFDRPFVRHLFNSLGGIQTSSGNLAIHYDKFRAIFDAVEAERPNEKATLDVARQFLIQLEARAQPVFIEQVLAEALSGVSAVIT